MDEGFIDDFEIREDEVGVEAGAAFLDVDIFELASRLSLSILIFFLSFRDPDHISFFVP